MIYTETITINGKRYKHTYSDTYTISRDGMEYCDAVNNLASLVGIYVEIVNS